MSDPIVYISHNRVKEGRLDDFRRFDREGVKLIEANRPGTLVHLAYTNEAGTEVTMIHLFPDAAALDRHMLGAGDRTKGAYEFIEPIRLEIYGEPSPTVAEAIQKLAGSGIPLSQNPHRLGGYIRPSSG